MSDPIRAEIEREIADNTILVYGKGTKDAPQCGFTLETIQFFNHFGYPFEVVNVLENMPKRAALPDAEFQIWDRTGTMDHFDVLIRSNAFAGKSLLDRHRLVEKTLKPARDDGRIHALAIRTELLET